MKIFEDTILLVEDNPGDVLLTQRAFRKANLPNPIEVVQDGATAVAYLAGKEAYADRQRYPLPLLILLDLKLPRKTGFEVLAWLQQQSELRHIPVVVLTASKAPADIKRAYDLGANSYLVKPVTVEALLDVMHTLALPLAAPLRIVLLDDEPGMRALIVRELSREFPGLQVEHIIEDQAFAQTLERGDFGLVITDHRLRWTDGLTVLRMVKARYPDCPVVMFTATGSEEIAVEAMKGGLDDYVLKSPKHRARLPGAVRSALARARHRQAVREAESRYRTLFEELPIGLGSMAPPEEILDANPALVEILGYPDLESLLAVKAPDLHADARDHQRFLSLLERDGIVRNFEVRMRRRDGRIIWGRQNARLIRDAGGRILRCEGSLEDITERKQAEETLRGTLAELTVIYRNMPIAMMLVDRDRRVRKVNGTVALFAGRSEEEMLGLRGGEALRCLHHLDDHQGCGFGPSCTTCAVRLAVLDTFATRKSRRDVEAWLPFPRGDSSEERCLLVSTAYLHVDDTERVLVCVQDTTERKRGEEALLESEQRYRALFESVPVGIGVADLAGNILAANRGMEEITGYSQEECKDIRLADTYIDPEQRKALLETLQESGRVRDWEAAMKRKDGTVYFALLNVDQVQLRGKTVLLTTIRDITEQKQAAQEIRHRLQELEAVNRVSTALRAASTLDEMLPILLDETLAVLGTDAGAIWLFDTARDEMHKAAARGWLTRLVKTLSPLSEGFIGQVSVTGEPQVAHEFISDPRLHPALRDQVPAGWGGACVPIRAAQEIIGVFFISMQLPRETTANEIHLLTTLAEIAGNAIHRARLHEQTERRLKHVQALHVIDIAISSSMDLRVTLNVLLEQVVTQLHVDAADILLLNPHTQILEYAAGRGFRSRKIESARLRLGEGHAGIAALERRIVSIPNLTEDSGSTARASLLTDEGFITYHGVPFIAKGQVKGILEIFHRTLLTPDPEWLEFLEALAAQAAIAIDNAELFTTLQRSNVELALAYDTTLEGWSRAMDLRDKETEGHTQRVTEITVRLARALGVSEDELVHVRRGALLHDMGKMGVPDAILLKPGTLTDDEWKIMRQHPQFAFAMLAPISYLKPALDIPYCHHEKWDGTGYPRGLKDIQIPLAARIFAVVDVWDALTSDRPYRKAWPEEKVREYLREQAGKHFDPKIVETFLSVLSLG